MVRLFIEPPNGNAQQAVENWVSNYAEWEADPVDGGETLRVDIGVTNTGGGGDQDLTLDVENQ